MLEDRLDLASVLTSGLRRGGCVRGLQVFVEERPDFQRFGTVDELRVPCRYATCCSLTRQPFGLSDSPDHQTRLIRVVGSFDDSPGPGCCQCNTIGTGLATRSRGRSEIPLRRVIEAFYLVEVAGCGEAVEDQCCVTAGEGGTRLVLAPCNRITWGEALCRSIDPPLAGVHAASGGEVRNCASERRSGSRQHRLQGGHPVACLGLDRERNRIRSGRFQEPHSVEHFVEGGERSGYTGLLEPFLVVVESVEVGRDRGTDSVGLGPHIRPEQVVQIRILRLKLGLKGCMVSN